MRLNKKGETDFIHFPIVETEAVMAYMEQAEKTGDFKTLKWCARLLLWIFKTMLEKDGICTSDRSTLFCNGKDNRPVYSARKFNNEWENVLKANQRGTGQ